LDATEAEAFEAALLLFVLRYVLEEASEFVGFESRGGGKRMRLSIKWDYFLDAWNILDWFNLMLGCFPWVIGW